jgi:hypothetical protein
MPYLVFELTGPPQQIEQYGEFLSWFSCGVQNAARHLLRALNMMAPRDGFHYHGAVFVLARHVAEEVDAISVLLEKGCVDPCKAHLRSAFEADLGVRYILQRDSERRGIAYKVTEARDRLRANEKYDARTPAGQRLRDATKADLIGSQVLESLPEHDFDAENENLRAMLARPPFDLINSEWDTGKHKQWYALFGGPRTIRDLAYRLNRGFWYEFLYSGWSDRIHAGRALRNVGINSKEPDRKGNAIRPIRHPEGIHDVFNFSLGIAVMLAFLLGEKYLTGLGQEELRRFYNEDIRPVTSRVKKTKITADWY